MEKVKLTQEQAKAIKRWVNKEQLIIAKASGLLEHSIDESIAELTMEQLVKALYIGYEVEPEFKKGDYVMVKWKNREKEEFYRVVSIDPWGSIHIETLDGSPNSSGHENTRHATPEEIAAEKERRWWKKHGRDVWELRKGDVLYDSIEEEALVFEKYDQDLDDEVAHFTNGLWEPMRNVKRRLRVVSFAEQRLDREGQQ